MDNLLKVKKIRLITWNSVLLVIGFLFCILPETSLSILETIVTTCLILYGVFCLLTYLFTPQLMRDSSYLVTSILFILAGVLLDAISSLFIVGMGIFILIQGVVEIGYGTDLKSKGDKKYKIDLGLGFLFLILGIAVIILCGTSIGVSIVSLILGISIILYAGGNLYLILALHRTFDKIKWKNKYYHSDENSKNEKKDNENDSTDVDDFKDYNIN